MRRRHPGCQRRTSRVDVRVSGATHRVEPGELVGVRADDRTAARIADALLHPHTPSDLGGEVEVLLDGARSMR